MEEEIKLKVCGMRDPDNIREVSQLQPHYMGFIFYALSPRYVGDDFRMPDSLLPGTSTVGVFVNESTERILQKVQAFGLDLVQLHGDESPAQCREVKKMGVGVIKVFSVDDETDFHVTGSYADSVDYFLFDTKGKYFGGNARTFNWEILSRYDQRIPFFLSGGITPDHIEDIKKLKKKYNLQAIDVNSGVEVHPAFKDVQQISAIKKTLNIKQ